MITVRGYTALPRALRSPVVAIGNFDGAHRGHVHIFAETRTLASRLAPDAESVVLTFDPHPAKVLAPEYAPLLITSLARKLELIEQADIDAVVVQPFDRAFAARSAADFVDEVLVRGLQARGVCVGHDFTFGRKREGTTDRLRELCAERHIEVRIAPAFTVDGIVCSSTKVREFVLEGRMDGARLLLGRDFDLEGEVVHGDGRGRTIGVPTANVRAEAELAPRNGVYAGWAELVARGDDAIPDDQRKSGPVEDTGPGGVQRWQRWAAAINVGTNPTFMTSSAPVRVEAHLLDAAIDLYGRRLRLGFTKRLRDEERFASVEALIAQIRRDVDATRSIWEQRG